jgi:hypothetical protein
MRRKNLLLLAFLALVGWVLCGATMGIGRTLMTLQTTLIVHAIAAPVFFSLLSLAYARSYALPGPWGIALFFTGFVILLDVAVVAPMLERSFAMFGSIPGTWLPFALIFAASYLTVRTVYGRKD